MISKKEYEHPYLKYKKTGVKSYPNILRKTTHTAGVMMLFVTAIKTLCPYFFNIGLPLAIEYEFCR